ncbi:MAG: hypothetical protein RIT02_961, partial [Planctomycetota bacterium]
LALQNATVQISDLNSEGAFGLAGTRLIQLDDDALGFGWHVGSGPVPTGAVDLGTVMRHELGHILGYGDLDPATAGDSIMSGTLLPGDRRTVSQREIVRFMTTDKPTVGLAVVPGEPETLFPPTHEAVPLSHIPPAGPTAALGDSGDIQESAVIIRQAALGIEAIEARDPVAQKSDDLEVLDELFSDALSQLF